MILMLADESQANIPTQAEIAERCQFTEGHVHRTPKNHYKFGSNSTLTYSRNSSLVTGEVEGWLAGNSLLALPNGACVC